MKKELEIQTFNLTELSNEELTSTEGGIIRELFWAIGAVVAAIVNDAERVHNGQPVSMPSGMKTMYYAHG